MALTILYASNSLASYAFAQSSPVTFDYTIKEGDTLYLLSLRFDTTVDKLYSMNPLSSVPENLMVGSKLKITSGSGTIVYQVKKGEVLWQIAKDYNTSVDSIAYKNYIKNPDMIFAGDMLAVPDPKVQAELMAMSKQIVTMIKSRDFAGISKVAHPEKWIRFSPYAHVDINSDIVFWPPTIARFSVSNTKYTWGVYDGSGEPIELTPRQYFDRFVYGKDFASGKVSFNKIIGKGNTLENQFSVYPKANIVEYYIGGTEKYGYMDWQSLRLVFERYNNKWYLVGIIHNEWTT